MPVLKNLRWERYAQEIAAGNRPGAASVAAGYKKTRGNQSRLKLIPEVSARIDELRLQIYERTMKKAAITKADIIDSLLETRKVAKAEGQLGASLKADELLGKSIGMFIERTEVGRPGEFEGLNDRGELIEAVRQELEASARIAESHQLAGSPEDGGEEPDIVH